MAEIFNAEMAPHLYAGPVEWAANVHFAASIPNLLIAETIETGGAFHLKLIKNTIKWEDGYILPPEAPGLGIDFDEDLARAHPFTGTGLHLQMQEAPCDYRHGNRFEGGAPCREDLTPHPVATPSEGLNAPEDGGSVRKNGGPGRNRTLNLGLRRSLLYPVELRARAATFCDKQKDQASTFVMKTEFGSWA